MNKTEIINYFNINIATLKNWIATGLNIDITSGSIDKSIVEAFIKDNNKLNSRVNKTTNKKNVIPKELTKILNEVLLKNNIELIDKYIEFISQSNIIDTIIFKRIEDISKKEFSNKKYLSLLSSKKSSLNINRDLLNELNLEDNNYLLGVLVQYTMGSNNQSNFGTFYTPIDIIETLIPKDIKGKTFLEPCSGSGYFLFEIFKRIKEVTTDNPLNYIYGNDIDSHAVLSSIIELIDMSVLELEYVEPKILNQDGLKLKIDKVDYVLTNPPYGSNIENKELEEKLKTKESYSFFIYKILNDYLKTNGKMFLVLPDSILKIKSHFNIRKIILNNGLYQIDFLGKRFKGVMSDIVLLYIDRTFSGNNILYKELDKNNNNNIVIDKKIIEETAHTIINKYKTVTNYKLLETYLEDDHFYLNEKDFYLGIVTGNNAKKIKTEKDEKYNAEVIQGKNFVKDIKFYISLEDSFQQSPDLKVYRRNKIVYKFISSTIRTKVDIDSFYTINSVNIYSPESITKEELDIISRQLNSDKSMFILHFYYGDIVKVLKEHLCIIPIFKV